MKLVKPIRNCHCDSGKPYTNCCGLYHEGAVAPNALALMRSRYSAYVLGLEAYLLATWHPDTRPKSLHLSDADKQMVWQGLSVESTEQVSVTGALVTFVARYKDLALAGRAVRLEEKSVFQRIDQQWFYVEAIS